MTDQQKTKTQLIQELDALRQRVAELEQAGTERQHLEETLHESQERVHFLADVIEHTSQPFGVGYADGHLGAVNAAFCQLTGYSADELRSMSWATQLTPPEWWSVEQQFLKEIQRTSQPVRYEKEYIRKDGSRVPVELLVHPGHDLEGNIVYYYAFVTDITERRQAAAALRESEERYRGFFENVVVGAFHSTPEGRFLRVNSAAARMLGYASPEEMVSSVTNIRTQLYADPDKHPQFLSQTLQQDGWFRAENRYRRKDGRIITANLALRKVLNADGTLAYLEGFIEDMTGRRQIELAERDQRALAEALRDTASALSSTLDLDRVLDHILANVGRVVPHSIANIMLVEAGIAQVVRRKDPDGYEPEKWALANRFTVSEVPNMVLMYKTGLPCVIPDTSADPDWINFTESSWISSYAGAPIQIERQVFGFLNLVSEVRGFYTPEHARRLQAFADQAALAIQNARLYQEIHRRAAELEQRVAERTLQLRKAKEQVEAVLEKEIELNKIKSRFISTASHEFRTPMAVIQTSSDLLERYDSKMTAEQKQKEYHRIRANIAHMVELLDDVLLINKTEASKPEFHPEPLDLDTLCQELLAEFEATSGVNHRFVFSCSGPCRAFPADRKLLRHILSNLLSNAIKYSAPETTVTFTIRCQPDQAVFQVRDQGIGIPAAHQQRLFEMFQRAENVRDIPGTGLGLAIAKLAVESHGGTITFESSEGGGTCFTVTLPHLAAAGTPA